MKINKMRLTIILLGTLVLGLAIWWLSRPEPIAVSLVTVDQGLVEVTVANTRAGTIKACRRAKLAPATGGQVAKLNVKEGDRVKEGQILLELWNDDLAAQVQLATNDVQVTRLRREEICLLAGNAQRDAERMMTLKAKGLAAEEATDRAVAEAKSRNAACQAALATAKASESRLEVTKATLERTLLRAPFAGIVAEVNGEVGEFVTPSPTGVQTPPAIDLIDSSCLYVLAPIDEVDTQAIKPGMRVRISLDVLPGRQFKGRVSRTAPYVLELEKQARTIDVEVLFENPEDYAHLVPGYSVDVEIILDAQDNVLRVPTEALVEGNKVLLYDAKTKTVVERKITPGKSNWKYTEILTGVTPGEQVIVSVDREGVKPGAYVVPEENNPVVQ